MQRIQLRKNETVSVEVRFTGIASYDASAYRKCETSADWCRDRTLGPPGDTEDGRPETYAIPATQLHGEQLIHVRAWLSLPGTEGKVSTQLIFKQGLDEHASEVATGTLAKGGMIAMTISVVLEAL